MDLKQATAVCLVSLFSATLVLLIARALDVSTASRLEPQLARIVEELHAIRRAGGGAVAGAAAGSTAALDTGLTVYYLHGNVRCPTCRAIEAQALETLKSRFASRLASGEINWKVVNYEEPSGEPLREKFEVQIPMVVLARVSGGRMQSWKRLDQVWALVNDQAAFSQYIATEVDQMLAAGEGPAAVAQQREVPETPAAAPDEAELPLPPAELPLPDPEVAELPLPGVESDGPGPPAFVDPGSHGTQQAAAGPNGDEVVGPPPDADCLMVYYFHANTRCPTCRSIEEQAREAVQTGFPVELQHGQLRFETLNYEDPAAADLAQQFQVQVPVVVLARVRQGKVEDWESLDEVWSLVDDRPAFAAYVQQQVMQMLPPAGELPAPQPPDAIPETPLRGVDADDPPARARAGEAAVPR